MIGIANQLSRALICRAGPGGSIFSHAARRMVSCECVKYDNVTVEKVGEKKNVAVITMTNRKTRNALYTEMLADIFGAAESCDSDKDVGCIVLTGQEKVFSSGANISKLRHMTFQRIVTGDFPPEFVNFARKPIIAAINGHALGGGCELALACDILYASEKALIGQVEVSVGAIPGAQGTQTLTREVKKSLAMEMILTGNWVPAERLYQAGMISKIFEPSCVLDEAVKTAEKIASNSKLTVVLAKEAVRAAYETSLSQGLAFERKIFESTFATNDKQEGVNAFVEKRKANFTDS